MSIGNKLAVFLNREALERLLGCDSELEVRLRHQVVEEFTKRHLAEVIKSEAYKETCAAMRVTMLEAIKQEVGQTSHYYYTTEINQEVQNRIRDKVREVVRNTIDQEVRKKMDDMAKSYEDYWSEWIDRKVKAVFDQNIKRLVDEEFAKRTEKLRDLLKGV